MDSSNNQCYLCGKISENLTRDHLIPVCLFPEPRPSNLITLPACLDCQREYQKDEEYFRTVISPISNVRTNQNAKAIWQKARRSLSRRPSLYRAFTSSLLPVNIKSPSGLYLGTAIAIKISQDRTEKVLRKIALGLFYYHTQTRIPDSFKTEIYFQPKEILPELLKKAQFVRYFKDTFSYAGAIAKDNMSSIWWMSFYRSVAAIVIFLSPKDS